jgi:hypothetical protein
MATNVGDDTRKRDAVRRAPVSRAPLSAEDSEGRMAAPSMEELADDRLRVFSLLRAIREDAQNIQRKLLPVLDATTVGSAKVHEGKADELFREAKHVFEHDAEKVEARLKELRILVGELPSRPWVGNRATFFQDEVDKLENLWEDVKYRWPERDRSLTGDLRHGLQEANGSLREIILMGTRLTCHERVNRHLAGLSVGAYMDFHAAFDDELPLPPRVEDSDRILRFLHDHRGVIDGVVDVPHARIYSASSNPWRRWASVGCVVLVVAIGAAFAFALGAFGTSLVPKPLQSDHMLLKVYGAVVGGALVHVVVDAIKQTKKRASEESMTPSDWLLWVHVNEVAIVLSGAAGLLLAFVGLVLVFQTSDLETAFFVGYAADSFVDVFLSRFEKVLSSNVAALRKEAEVH